MQPSVGERTQSGVVVGVHRTATAATHVRWAAGEARRRHLPLTLVHAWREPLTITVEIDAHDLHHLDLDFDLDRDPPVRSHAEPGRAASVLLAQPASLLVLGGHMGSPHATHAMQLCLQRAACPVVVVPEEERPSTGVVVVGVDDTPAALAALTWADHTAQLRGARLLVVHAWQLHPHSPGDVLHHRRTMAQQQREQDERLQARVRGGVSGTTDVEVHAVHGAPLDVLLRFAERADLLVLGRRHHHGISRVFNGAVSDELSALAPCPIAVVPPTAAENVLA